MAAPLPWFPLYINDFEFDEAVRLMSYEERGIYVVLLCWQWREGTVPHDVRKVARTIRAPAQATRHVMDRCFRDDGSHTGRLVNAKLAELRVNQLTKAGKSSAAARGWKTTEERYLYAAEATFFLPNSDGPDRSETRIKIGWSRNPKNRLRALGRELRIYPKLLGMRPATISLERKAHVDLAIHKDQGEWFCDVPAVRQWLVANGVTEGTSGNTTGSPAVLDHSETGVRSRIKSQIQKSLGITPDAPKGNGDSKAGAP